MKKKKCQEVKDEVFGISQLADFTTQRTVDKLAKTEEKMAKIFWGSIF